MAGQNDFLIFDENRVNMLTDDEYSTDTDRLNGFESGLARSIAANKVLYQTSKMASALGAVIANNNDTATDSKTANELRTSFMSALHIGVKNYDSTYTYSLNEVVEGDIDGIWGMARSLSNNNTGNALTNTTYWEVVGNNVWGKIAGTLSNQTDLQTELTSLSEEITSVYNTLSASISTIQTTLSTLSARRYISTAYVSGTSWYRVWSDGWKEQGGDCGTSSDTNTTITFLRSFSNANYFICKNFGYTSTGGTAARWIGFWDLTTTNATTGSLGSGLYQRWYACGY